MYSVHPPTHSMLPMPQERWMGRVWVHPHCYNMPDDFYERLGASSFVWLCPSCELPHYSSHSLRTTFSLSSSPSSQNSFSTLTELASSLNDTDSSEAPTTPRATSSPKRTRSRPPDLKILLINRNSIASQTKSRSGQFIALTTAEDPDIIIGT